MTMKRLIASIVVVVAVSFNGITAYASAPAKGVFDKLYPSAASQTSCFVCHTGGPGNFTSYGLAYLGQGGVGSGTTSAMKAIEANDPDGDGKTFLDEINAGTISPVSSTQSTASITGCLTSSSTLPITMFFALMMLVLYTRRPQGELRCNK